MLTEHDWLSSNILERVANPREPFSYTRLEARDIPTPYPPISFVEACDSVAKKLGARFGKLYLGLSGGMDSERAFRALNENNVDFTPVIVRWPANHEETDLALKICASRCFEPVIIEMTDFEVVAFCGKEIVPKLNGCGYNSVGQLVAAQYAKDNGGKFVFPDHMYNGLNEWDFYIDAYCGGDLCIPFYYYDLQIHEAMAREFEEWGKQLPSENEFKAKLYDIPYRRKVFPVANLSPELWKALEVIMSTVK